MCFYRRFMNVPCFCPPGAGHQHLSREHAEPWSCHTFSIPVTTPWHAPAAHVPHAPLQHGCREAAELGEALSGSRLGKMLTQTLHILSPLSPASPTAAVNPKVHPSAQTLPTALSLTLFLSFSPHLPTNPLPSHPHPSHFTAGFTSPPPAFTVSIFWRLIYPWFHQFSAVLPAHEQCQPAIPGTSQPIPSWPAKQHQR